MRRISGARMAIPVFRSGREGAVSECRVRCMREFSDRSQDPSVSGQRSRRLSLRLSHLLLPAAILTTAALAGLVIIDPYAPAPMTVATAPEPQPSVTPDPYAWLLDPGYSLGMAPRPLDRGQKQSVAGLIPASPQPPARPATIARVEPEAPAQSQIALPPLPGEKPLSLIHI